MENRCECCGRKIGIFSYGDDEFCDGILTLGPNPFAQEIHGDNSDYWMCERSRYDSAMDI